MIAIGEFTLAEFIALSKRAPSDPTNRDHWNRYYKNDPKDRSEGNPKYYGGLTTWQDARDLFEKGWSKGADQVNALRSAIGEVLCAKSTKRRACYGADGDDLRIDHALAGDWDHAWRTSKRELARGNATVELLVTFGGHGGRTSEELLWSGAAATILTDMLEEAGYRVALTAALISNIGNATYWVPRVLLKEAQQPLQIDTTAALLCHAGMLRTFGFRGLLEAPFAVGFGLGRPCTWSEVKSEMESVNQWPSDAVIVEAAYTRDGALAEIKRVLSRVQGSAPVAT